MEIVHEENHPNSASDQGWPSIAAPPVEDQSDSHVVDVESSSEEKWPSINSPTSGGMDDSVPETEWPSIALIKQDENVLEEALEAEDEPSQWPSISLDGLLDAEDSGDVVETIEDPVVGDNDSTQEFDGDQASNSETSSSEDLYRVDSPDQVMTALEENLAIPDLPLSNEPVETKNPSIREAIKQEKSTHEIESIAQESGMLTLKTYAIDLIAKQLTTISELQKICNTDD